jgi:hypothetical protein
MGVQLQESEVLYGGRVAAMSAALLVVHSCALPLGRGCGCVEAWVYMGWLKQDGGSTAESSSPLERTMQKAARQEQTDMDLRGPVIGLLRRRKVSRVSCNLHSMWLWATVQQLIDGMFWDGLRGEEGD